jgi:formate dehydrogenase major subunit
MTRATEMLNKEMPRGFVQINAEDAGRLRIRNSAMVTLKTRRGAVRTSAAISKEVPQGLLFIPIHFAEACANILTNPALDPSCKMPEFKVCAARVETS